MTKEKENWKSKLVGEITPLLHGVGRCIDKADIGGARDLFELGLLVLRKPRICESCGEIYWHDVPSILTMCDECEGDSDPIRDGSIGACGGPGLSDLW